MDDYRRGVSTWKSPGGDAYAARFDALAAKGVDIHGEAAFVERLAPPGCRVLDAGCGTGRVAIELARRGFEVVGLDVDPDMLATARRRAPELTWVRQDLLRSIEGRFEVIVAAGNVIPLVSKPAEVVANLAKVLTPDGILIAGFGLDPRNLPLDEAPVSRADYDAMCAAAGLQTTARYATWDGAPYMGGGYAVSVSRRVPAE